MGNQRRVRLIKVMVAAAVWVACLGFIAYNVVPSHLYWEAPDPARQARDTQALRAVLPVLEELRVTGYVNNGGGCHEIEYSGGAFSNRVEDSCLHFLTKPGEFTPVATAAYDRVTAALEGSRVWVRTLYAQSDADGKLTGYRFHLAGWLLSSYFTYIYEPGYTLPEDWPGKVTNTRIDSDWYYDRYDWLGTPAQGPSDQ